MRWLPWRWLTRHRQPNGHSARDAERSACAKLADTQARAPEVQAAIDRFAASVERAMRGVG